MNQKLFLNANYIKPQLQGTFFKVQENGLSIKMVLKGPVYGSKSSIVLLQMR